MSIKIDSKNADKLEGFSRYCRDNPEQRFWQALRNWNQLRNPSQNFILTAEVSNDYRKPYEQIQDTFYRE